MQLKAGQTTKQEVYVLFGQPYEVVYITDGDESVWSHFSAQMTTNAVTYIPIVNIFLGGSNAHVTVADMYFDGEGVFKKFERREFVQYRSDMATLGDLAVGGEREDVISGVEEEMTQLGLSFDPELAESQAVFADLYIDEN